MSRSTPRRPVVPVIPSSSVVDQLGRLLREMRTAVETTQDDDRYPVKRDVVVDRVTAWADALEAALARLVPPPLE